MTQDERWQENYDEVIRFVKTSHRNLSKYEMNERRLFTWLKHQRKVMNAGELKPERVAAFKELLAVCETYRRKNQYETQTVKKAEKLQINVICIEGNH